MAQDNFVGPRIPEKPMKLILVIMISLSFLSVVSAISFDYYYHPQCGHCKTIEPFIQNILNNYPNVENNVYDISQGSFDVGGTPLLKLFTNDNREILLRGSQQIPKYLECELNEMSTKECLTSTQLNCETNSFFIR